MATISPTEKSNQKNPATRVESNIKQPPSPRLTKELKNPKFCLVVLAELRNAKPPARKKITKAMSMARNPQSKFQNQLAANHSNISISLT